MQFRFVKDLAIALIVILLGFLAVRLVMVENRVSDVPEKSVYTKESVSDTLMSQIQTIENSIQDRKMFVFNSRKDPLRQGNIIKDKVDRQKEFEEMVRNTFRLSTTAIDEFGNRIAYVEYQDALHAARVGDTVAGRRILEINEKNIRYSMGGNTYTANLMPRPVMTQDDPYVIKGTSGNW
ncbi:MAG: hypothetical protein PHU99_04635 [Candidatus Cloacimonetes bacterium]|jgi:hypothetical protein|nr:hypothetical protein [Candidatus Cloacimonadota bacterium]MDY0336822.1 hypothetical protein [Candidatus Cloacimonadaceae bacterium]MCB5269335.1 hypothetical protein [Candidatus Cloacimonadota bacterium]MCK9333807.1 hypothetical protein [Candidatus Cloacimonadota bacterium]MDD2543966.1 hypothetical protein [Candidatus Cloacimonadota bacterium]